MVGYVSSGGILQSVYINTVRLCQTACTADSGCLAADFRNYGSPTCWLHYDSNFASTRRAITSINQYVKDSMCGGESIMQKLHSDYGNALLANWEN